MLLKFITKVFSQIKGHKNKGKIIPPTVTTDKQLPTQAVLSNISHNKHNIKKNFYKSGYREQQLKDSPQCIKRVFSLQNCTTSQITAYKTRYAINRYGLHQRDCGSPAVQVVAMTQKILNIVSHIKQNRKDHKTSRFLHKLLARRKKMISYLMAHDYQRWAWIANQYGIKLSRSRNTDMCYHNNWKMYNTTQRIISKSHSIKLSKQYIQKRVIMINNKQLDIQCIRWYQIIKKLYIK